MTEISNIYDVLNDEEDNGGDNIDNLDDNNLSKVIMDLSIKLETRLTAINRFHDKFPECTVELVNKLSMMYELSNTKSLRDYLYDICIKTEIPYFLKCIIAQTLATNDNSKETGCKIIDIIYPKLDDSIGTPFKIELIKLLMLNDNYKESAHVYFISNINDNKLNCDYRYKLILGLEQRLYENDSDEEKKEKVYVNKKYEYFIIYGCFEFVKNDNNTLLYRILASQNLLQREINLEMRKNVESLLYSFAENESFEYNKRADATDVLLQYAQFYKEKAKIMIMKLGNIGGDSKTVYNNAQNVHSKEVEDGIKDAIEFLQTYNIMRDEITKDEIDLAYVERKVFELLEDKYTNINKDKVVVSFNRIGMDKALYSKYNCRLVHILLRIWTYISSHDNQEELQKRLIEELEEMSDTCSSGFASRLVNSISGFGDFSTRISWGDQINANMFGRLNARIRNMDDLELQEKVLSQMTINSNNFDERQDYLRFLRENMLDIRKELFDEFKSYISDTDFDLYFRIALSNYEGSLE